MNFEEEKIRIVTQREKVIKIRPGENRVRVLWLNTEDTIVVELTQSGVEVRRMSPYVTRTKTFSFEDLLAASEGQLPLL